MFLFFWLRLVCLIRLLAFLGLLRLLFLMLHLLLMILLRLLIWLALPFDAPIGRSGSLQSGLRLRLTLGPAFLFRGAVNLGISIVMLLRCF